MSNGDKYTVSEAPIFAPRRIRIVSIGAGASGINLIRTLKQTLQHGTFEHVVYEKNSGVGGTWFENRYPGCRCDVPSHSYQFSWRRNPEWTNLFAPADEIQKYLDTICDEENIRDVIKTSHKVLSAEWDEGRSVWIVKVKNLRSGEEFEDTANFLIDASGILNNWSWPKIDGREDFEGEMVHTAAWKENFSVKGKSVAVIGNGASGVQVLPKLLPDVKRLYHPIRTPTWILPPRAETMKRSPAASFFNEIGMDAQENFTSDQIQRFKDDQPFYEKVMHMLDSESTIKFVFSLVKGSKEQAWAKEECRKFMAHQLGDEELCKALIPDFSLGCRRLTPAPGYLEAMKDPKVKVTRTGIKRFVKEGIELVNGEVLKVDVVVCATGFNSSFQPPFPIIGRKCNLQAEWAAKDPASYMSLGVAEMPNYFKFFGPHAPIAHGDSFKLSEHIATYIANAIRKCQVENILSMCPSNAAVADYTQHVSSFMPRTAWSDGCRSWYKGKSGEGEVVGLHPGSRMHFIRMLKEFRGEDWEYVYGKRNRFGYLGNGFSQEDLEAMEEMEQAMIALKMSGVKHAS